MVFLLITPAAANRQGMCNRYSAGEWSCCTQWRNVGGSVGAVHVKRHKLMYLLRKACLRRSAALLPSGVRPTCEVLRSFGYVEPRQYSPCVVAELLIKPASDDEGAVTDAGSEAFSLSGGLQL